MITTTYSIAFFLAALLAFALLLNSWRAALSLLKSSLLLGFYAALLIALHRLPEWQISWEAHLLSGMAIPMAVTILTTMVFAATAYLMDRYFDRAPKDDFKGSKLFFRYGQELSYTAIPIGLEDGIGPEDAEGLRGRLSDFLLEHLQERFGALDGASLKLLQIKDLNSPRKQGEQTRHGEKAFLRLAFHRPRQTGLYCFIHLECLSQHLLVHRYTYLLGQHAWHHALFFVFAAPFHVWRWGLGWVLGRHNTLSQLNRHFEPAAFNLMDLRSRHEAAHFALIAALRRFAKVYGLLTEDLECLLNNQLSTSLVALTRKSVSKLAFFK
jgi:hypothetical protein